MRYFEKECYVTCRRNKVDGGLSVGTGDDTSVIVEHLPSETTAECGIHRSQHRNREACMDMIEIVLAGTKYQKQ